MTGAAFVHQPFVIQVAPTDARNAAYQAINDTDSCKDRSARPIDVQTRARAYC